MSQRENTLQKEFTKEENLNGENSLASSGSKRFFVIPFSINLGKDTLII